MNQYLFIILVFLLGALTGTLATYLGTTDILASLNHNQEPLGPLINDLPDVLKPYAYKTTTAPLNIGRYFTATDTIIIYNGYFQPDTIRHEIAHRIYNKILTKNQKNTLKKLYQNTTEFITGYASKNAQENFAENFACYYTPLCQPTIEPQMLELLNQINNTLTRTNRNIK